MAKSKNDPEAVERYLASLSEPERAALEDLRRQIKTIVPEVQERISYGTAVILAVKKDLVGFVAQEKHLSFLTMSPDLARSMRAEITQTHRLSGATIHFDPQHPLPARLVGRIVRARLAEQSNPNAV
jgi:uncharacterized protein YdhG (YjbR/CyaY superfamily)